MALDADLYVERMDLAPYVAGPACDVCRVDSFDAFVERLRSGRLCAGRCPHWPAARVEAFRLAIEAGEWLPRVPMLQTPRPAEPGVVALNGADACSPVLVTGNSQLTHEVLAAVLAHTDAPLWLLAVDTGGHTVDMALVFETLTADGVARAAAEVDAGPVVLPGLAAGLADDLRAVLAAPVEVGPVCAAELPLHLGARWRTAGGA